MQQVYYELAVAIGKANPTLRQSDAIRLRNTSDAIADVLSEHYADFDRWQFRAAVEVARDEVNAFIDQAGEEVSA